MPCAPGTPERFVAAAMTAFHWLMSGSLATSGTA